MAKFPALRPSWVVLAASFAGMFGIWIPHAGFGVFIPSLSTEFGWSRGAISSVASLNLLLGGVLGFWVGAVNDRLGPRPILAVGAALTGTGYLFASAINALWQFYFLIGVLLGSSMSGLYLVPTAVVSRWFVENRGLALGIVLAGLNLAYVVGGPLSAVLISAFGWRQAYLLLGGVVWLVAVPASFFTKNPPSGEASGNPAARGTAAAFRSPAGATFREALADRRSWLLAATWFLLGFANMMLAIHIVPYVKDQGVTLERASLTLTIYGLSSIGGRLLFGAAADRLGTRPTYWFCLVLQLATFLAVLTRPPVWILYLLIMLFGLVSAGADTVVVKAAPEVFGVRAIGALMGFLSFGWRCGAALGPAAAGFLYDATGSYTVAFGFGAGALAMTLASFTLGVSPHRRRADAAR